MAENNRILNGNTGGKKINVMISVLYEKIVHEKSPAKSPF